MPTLDEVYRKFGEASEAAQLLETDLGTLLLTHKCIDAGLFEHSDPRRASAIYKQINKETLGQLIRSLGPIGNSVEDLDTRRSRGSSVSSPRKSDGLPGSRPSCGLVSD